MNREQTWYDTHCSYCEALLRKDGGCSMWYGKPHDLPYREREGTRNHDGDRGVPDG